MNTIKIIYTKLFIYLLLSCTAASPLQTEASAWKYVNPRHYAYKIYSLCLGFFSYFGFNKNIPVIPDEEKIPCYFNPKYDVGFFGIEKLHPFDTKKYGKVAAYLKQHLNITSGHFYDPKHQVSRIDLRKVHHAFYLESLKSSTNVARVAEVWFLSFLPNFLLQRNVLAPMRYATQGTIDAAQLALKQGVGINLSGGYHHAKSYQGSGFCFYADIPLAIEKLREKNNNLKIMYLDLDAHQGNGVEEYLTNDENAYIVDCYNEFNYPQDTIASYGIKKKLNSDDIYCSEHISNPRRSRAGYHCEQCSKKYREVLKVTLDDALKEFKPDIIFYNAGTDCFEKDPIGAMALDKEAIVERDELVFEQAKNTGIPICMTLSGGYSPESSQIIGASLVNLYKKGLLKHDVKTT